MDVPLLIKQLKKDEKTQTFFSPELNFSSKMSEWYKGNGMALEDCL